MARRLAPAIIITLVLLLIGAAQHALGASGDPAAELAAKYAPIVKVDAQTGECDTNGEPYGPSSVNPILGNSQFSFTRDNVLVLKGPTAADLWDKPLGYAIDYPGDPLNPGCTYEQLARQLGMGVPPTHPTAYAHVTTQAGKPGLLVLQYWFFYLFNDYNNKHEGDWEMAQLVFKATDAAGALKTAPYEMGLSQHNLGEGALWTDPKVQKQGSRPIIYPGRGSHANFYSQGLWLERSSSEGIGCDDTRGPFVTIPTNAVVLPNGNPGKTSSLAWIAYDGQWGAPLPPPFDGPPGPNTTDRWTNPITWQEQTRTSSTPIPTLGPSAVTDAFCSVVAGASTLLLKVSDNPITTLTILGIVIILLIYLARRTAWNRVPLDPIVRRRRAGQMVRSALSLMRRSPLHTLGVGLVFLPVAAITSGISWLVTHAPGMGSLLGDVEGDPVLAGTNAIAYAVPGGILGFVVAVMLVSAGMEARERDGRNPTLREIGHEMRLRLAGTAKSVGLRAVQIVLLTFSIIGIPWAIWLLIDAQLLPQVCVVEDRTGRDSRARARALVVGARVRVSVISLLASLIPLLFAPLLAMPFLLLGMRVWAVNLIGALFAAAFTPLAAVVRVLLYGDRAAATADDDA